MSFNLEFSVEKEGGDEAVLLLVGLSRGITHSALMSVGETVNLPITKGRLPIAITEIEHDWQPPGSQVAPNSIAFGVAQKQVSEEDFVYLLNLGCREI